MTSWDGYQMLLELGVDADVAAYVSGIDECGCVMPEQSCQMCRGAAKFGEHVGLAEVLAAPTRVAVAVMGDYAVMGSMGRAVVVDVCAGLKALVDADRYREYPCHIGGRTTPLFVAEPIEGRATGPTFTSMHPERWNVQTEKELTRNG